MKNKYIEKGYRRVELKLPLPSKEELLINQLILENNKKREFLDKLTIMKTLEVTSKMMGYDMESKNKEELTEMAKDYVYYKSRGRDELRKVEIKGGWIYITCGKNGLEKAININMIPIPIFIEKVEAMKNE